MSVDVVQGIIDQQANEARYVVALLREIQASPSKAAELLTAETVDDIENMMGEFMVTYAYWARGPQ